MPGLIMLDKVLLLSALSLALLLAACGGEPTCATACENLSDCGKLAGEEAACTRACEDDPSVTEGDVQCFSDSSCSELDACFPNVNPVTCWAMCEHVYNECGSSLQMGGGSLSQAQCVSLCRTKLSKDQINCARRAACNRVGTCF